MFWHRFACSFGAYRQKCLRRSSVGNLLRVPCWLGGRWEKNFFCWKATSSLPPFKLHLPLLNVAHNFFFSFLWLPRPLIKWEKERKSGEKAPISPFFPLGPVFGPLGGGGKRPVWFCNGLWEKRRRKGGKKGFCYWRNLLKGPLPLPKVCVGVWVCLLYTLIWFWWEAVCKLIIWSIVVRIYLG